MGRSTYRDAGVDLDLYRQAMNRLPALLTRTKRAGVMELPGGFAGLFRLRGGPRRMDDPVLVSGTDGVGTKIKVAIAAKRFDTIGIDLVAMCVNDCLCLGAEPLFFLDYIALGRDDSDRLVQLVEGVSEGCVQAGAALLGGETAIMPDLYSAGDFDMAGFCVGLVERDEIIDGTQRIKPGDSVMGLASSGLHSNGYSLVRKEVFERAGLSVTDTVPELDGSVAEILLRPTRIYASAVSALMQTQPAGSVHGIAHVTGGGLRENLERILPEQCRAYIDRSTWVTPAEFLWLQNLGDISRSEMFRVFNMGIGMAVVVETGAVNDIQTSLQHCGVESWLIGNIAAGDRDVEFTDA